MSSCRATNAKADAKGEVAKMLEEMAECLSEEGHPDLALQVELAAEAARHMQAGRDPWDPRMGRKSTVPVYTAADGSQWVEDPDGADGWWSERPGTPDRRGDMFDPWGRSVGDDAHGTDGGGGTVLRYYRLVEKR